MKIENVKALAEILTAYGLTSLEFNEGDTKIRLEKEKTTEPAQARFLANTAPVANASEPGADGQPVDFNRLIEVKSPLVGVFYAAPSPDSETFVRIGSTVKKGDVLCIIETMKLLNDITAEQDGEIVDICIRNGEIAEFGQVLFKMH